jgi:hypothetical protein
MVKIYWSIYGDTFSKCCSQVRSSCRFSYQNLTLSLRVKHISPIMATHTVTTDYASEKQEVKYAEHAQDSPVDSSYELQKERTLEGIDMNNSFAVKGDDSDGKVTWNVRSISCGFIHRLSSHPLLHWRIAWFHRRRPWARTWLSMASDRQHSRHCCGMSVRWISTGPIRQALHRTLRIVVYLYWVRACSDWSQLCTVDSRYGKSYIFQ